MILLFVIVFIFVSFGFWIFFFNLALLGGRVQGRRADVRGLGGEWDPNT